MTKRVVNSTRITSPAHHLVVRACFWALFCAEAHLLESGRLAKLALSAAVTVAVLVACAAHLVWPERPSMQLAPAQAPVRVPAWGVAAFASRER